MKIAIISDIHENFHNLILALEEIQNQNTDYIICLGDLMNAGIAKILAAQEIPSFMVWGNNDGEKVDIMKAAYRENSNLTISLFSYDFLELENKKIFISHYDNLAHPMAKSGLYDVVFYGHTHIQKTEKINQTWLVNPGEISAQKTGIASLAFYDTDDNEINIATLSNTISLKSDLVSDYLKQNADKLNFRSADAFDTKKG